MFYSDPMNYVISKKFRDLLLENNVTGCDTIPIQIEKHSEVEYFIFVITSKNAGKILNLEARSNYTEEFIKFDNKEWDGSDFFSFHDTRVKCCTERVKELIEKAKLTNIEFEVMIGV